MRVLRACCAIVVMVIATAAFAQASRPAIGAATRPFVLSKETTVALGPVRADGTIDYVAALNELYGKGVTRENNLAVPLLEAIGRGRGGDAVAIAKERVALGMAAEGGEAFVTLRGFAEQNWREGDEGNWTEIDEKLAELVKGPWTADQAPLAARWLAAVDKSLDALVTGSNRDRFYVPLVCEREPATVIKIQYSYLGPMRNLANALNARALLRLGAKDFDGYRQDVLALLRLGRVSSQSPTLIPKLVAIGCEALGLSTIQAAAGSAALSPEQCEQLAADLRSLPAASPMGDCFAHAERFMMLDYLVMCAVHGPIQAGRTMSGDAANMRAVDTSAKDWNEAFRKTNGWYDRLVEAGQKETYVARSQAAAKVDHDLEQLSIKWSGLLGPFAPIEDRMVIIMTASVGRAFQTETRLWVTRDLAEVALALRGYQAREGKYPRRLEDLSPKYLKAVPVDRFTERPLVYRLEAAGYVLYSVGPNGQDDGGEEAGGRRDDVTVRGGVTGPPR